MPAKGRNIKQGRGLNIGVFANFRPISPNEYFLVLPPKPPPLSRKPRPTLLDTFPSSTCQPLSRTPANHPRRFLFTSVSDRLTPPQNPPARHTNDLTSVFLYFDLLPPRQPRCPTLSKRPPMHSAFSSKDLGDLVNGCLLLFIIFALLWIYLFG